MERLSKIILVMAAAALLCLPAPRPASAGGAGAAGMQVLKTDISPRAMGMGGAFTAIADDAFAMNYNPAGLGQLYVPEGSALYLSGFEDSRLNNFNFAMPLPMPGFSGVGRPAAGLSFMMADAGDFTYRIINPNGSITTRSYDAQSDMALSLGYGEKVFSDEMSFEGYKTKVDQYLGFNAKYLRSTMLGTYEANSMAVDAGWLAMAPRLGLSAGASLSNLGPGLKYVSATTKLPSILRLGLSYQRPTVMDQSLMLAVDGIIYTAESLKSYRFGMEYHFEKIFNLRLGYRAGEDNNGLTMGLGIRYENMAMDLAFGSGAEVYNTTQLAFTYKFTGVRVKEYKKKTNFRGPDQQKAEPVRAAPRQGERTKPAAAPKKTGDSDFFWIY